MQEHLAKNHQKDPVVRETLNELLRESIEEALAKLTEKERKVVVLLFGLRNQKPLTPRAAAKKLALTVSEVKNLHREAQQKLAKCPKIQERGKELSKASG